MSPWSNAVRRLRGGPDGGFTIIEVLVAMIIVSLGAVGVVPLLIISGQAGNFAKLNTQAKNLAQGRVERLRDLQFHVELQNGNFVDLLDQYYTDLNTSPTARTFGAETLSGKWVNSGTPLSGEPALPFYRVTIASIAGYPAFSQTVTTQFLRLDGSAVPAALFSGYNSQAEVSDGPPSLLVGVTVLTTWKQGSQAKSFRNYTRIADSRGSVSTLTSQAKAQVLRVTSAASDLTALSADVAVASADGSQSTGSTAASSAKAGVATDANEFLVATGLNTNPGNATTLTTPVGPSRAGTGGCGWAAFGTSDVANISSSTTSGIPLVPANVDTGVPPSNQTIAGLRANGGNSCGLFAFNNRSIAYNPALGLGGTSEALVDIPDTGGAARVVTGSAWVNATNTVVSPHTVTSGANASSAQRIRIFPNLPSVLVGDSATNGLVDITLTASSIACSVSVTAGSAPVQTATASYTAVVDYWRATNTTGGGQRVSTTYSWSSAAAPSADPLAALSPSAIEIYHNGATVIRLSDYISSWSLIRALTEGTTNGVFSLDQVFALTTVPVRALDPTSSLGISVGRLSCAADDTR
ncbi:MAG: type II secretion system protein [Actinomycetota bacterium]